MTQTMESANAAASTLFLGHNGEWWDFCLILSVIVAALAALAVGITTAGSLVSHKREAIAAEKALDRYKLETGKQISAANAAGDAAKADAAKARLEQEKLKAQLAWRTIPPNVASKLLEALKSNPGSVNFRYVDGDPETLYLAVQLSEILSKAGWQVAPGSIKVGNILLFDIHIPDGQGEVGSRLQAAFASAGIKVWHETLPQQNSSVELNMTRIPDAPMLIVGSKRPTLP